MVTGGETQLRQTWLQEERSGTSGICSYSRPRWCLGAPPHSSGLWGLCGALVVNFTLHFYPLGFYTRHAGRGAERAGRAGRGRTERERGGDIVSDRE